MVFNIDCSLRYRPLILSRKHVFFYKLVDSQFIEGKSIDSEDKQNIVFLFKINQQKIRHWVSQKIVIKGTWMRLKKLSFLRNRTKSNKTEWSKPLIPHELQILRNRVVPFLINVKLFVKFVCCVCLVIYT